MSSNEDLAVIRKEILEELLHTLWGSDVSPDVFQRWNQGVTVVSYLPAMRAMFTSYECFKMPRGTFGSNNNDYPGNLDIRGTVCKFVYGDPIKAWRPNDTGSFLDSLDA